jgi:hypothetical protein
MTLVQNDVGVVLQFNVVDQNNAAVNLTGTTVYLKIKRPDTTLTKTCTITNATGGVCQYTTTAGDLSVGNATYYLELEVNYPNGNILSSSQLMSVTVRADV